MILAEEVDVPQGCSAVSWLLLTSLPVDNFDQALECVRMYALRWLIERYHYVLKSGCRIEELQLESAENMKKALCTYCIVAWRLLWLTYLARKEPELSCEEVLDRYEWESLYCMTQKKKVIPKKPPTLSQAVRWIAQLGGFLGRKGDGMPGVKTIWQGLRRLHDISETWLYAQKNPYLVLRKA